MIAQLCKLGMVVLFGVLAGCAQAGPIHADSPDPRIITSCKVDSDCGVKDVGNCCGYYPACVNKDSPTFPEEVAATCRKNNQVGICGFPVIKGCQCVEQRCVPGPASGGELQ